MKFIPPEKVDIFKMDSTPLSISVVVMIVSFIMIVVFFELKAKADSTSKAYKTYGILYWVTVGTLLAATLSACYGFIREKSPYATM